MNGGNIQSLVSALQGFWACVRGWIVGPGPPCPQRIHMLKFNHKYPRRWAYFEMRFCSDNQVKVRWLGGLSYRCPCKKLKFWCWATHSGKTLSRDTRIGPAASQVRGPERSFPHRPHGEPTLLTSGMCPCLPCETKKFCFRATQFVVFVTAALTQ